MRRQDHRRRSLDVALDQRLLLGLLLILDLLVLLLLLDDMWLVVLPLEAVGKGRGARGRGHHRDVRLLLYHVRLLRLLLRLLRLRLSARLA